MARPNQEQITADLKEILLLADQLAVLYKAAERAAELKAKVQQAQELFTNSPNKSKAEASYQASLDSIKAEAVSFVSECEYQRSMMTMDSNLNLDQDFGSRQNAPSSSIAFVHGHDVSPTPTPTPDKSNIQNKVKNMVKERLAEGDLAAKEAMKEMKPIAKEEYKAGLNKVLPQQDGPSLKDKIKHGVKNIQDLAAKIDPNDPTATIGKKKQSQSHENANENLLGELKKELKEDVRSKSTKSETDSVKALRSAVKKLGPTPT